MGAGRGGYIGIGCYPTTIRLTHYLLVRDDELHALPCLYGCPHEKKTGGLIPHAAA